MKEWEEFFRDHGWKTLGVDYNDNLLVEDLYDMFKDRLLDELRVDLRKGSVFGDLIKTDDVPPEK